MATESYIWNGTTLWVSDGSTPRVTALAEQDLIGRVNTFEEVGDDYAVLLRQTRRKQSSYAITCLLKCDGTYTTVQALKAWWRGLHSDQLGRKVLQRNTAAGNTRYLDCVAEEPQFSEDGTSSVEVTQSYTPTVLYWRSAEQSAVSAFNGSTPVNVSCDNDGDVPAWVRWVAEGVVVDPKLEIADLWEQEFSISLASGDELAANSQTPATVWHTPSGGSAARAYGYRTEASMFRTAKLPADATTNVVASATSGTGALTVYWYNWYEALA